MSNSAARPSIIRLACVWLLLAVVLPAIRAQGTDPAADLAQLRAKAEKGDLESQNVMGNVYTNALLGVRQDFAEALTWYRLAAEKGFAPAQFNLGLAYELGRGVPADDRQAFKHYLLAAEQGFASAQFNVGNMYSAGRGVGQDLFEANLWYKQAAEKGVVEAQFNLGLAYEAGRGVKKDEAQAARWYKQAADRGFARAQYNLGLLLEDGRGVAKNESAAAQFYRAAAEQGHAAAQNNYGVMVSEGRGGLAKDPALAYFWLSLAVTNGANPAARDFVAKALSNEQLAAARQLLEDRKAGRPLPAGSAPVVAHPAAPAAATGAGGDNSAAASRVAELTAALEKAAQANTQFAEANQKLELDKARLEQQLASQTAAGDSAKLVEQLREQSRRLAGQLQTLTVDKETAEREAKILAAQVKDAQEELSRVRAGGGTPAAAAQAADVAKYQAEITGLTARLAQATGDLAKLQQAQKELAETNTRLQKEMDALAAAPRPTAGLVADNTKYPVQNADKDPIIASLQRDNTRLNDEVKRSTRELLSLNAQLRALRSQTAAKPSADAGTGDQLAQLTAKAEQAAQEAGRLQAANTRLAARVAELEKQPPPASAATTDDSSAPKLAEARQLAAQLQEQLKSLQIEKADLEKWSQSLEKTVNEKTTAAEAAGTTLKDLQGRLAQTEQQLAAAQQAASSGAGWQAKAGQLEQDNARVGRQLAEATAALATRDQAVEKLAADNSSLVERVRRAEEALAAKAVTKPVPDETGPLRQQLAEAQDKAEQLAREKQALADRVAAEHGNYLRSQARVAILETDLRNAQQKPAPVDTTALYDLKKQLAEANAALEKSGATVGELTAANDRLEKQVAAAETARRDLTDAQARLADLQQQLSTAGQAAAEVAALRDENNRLRQSAGEVATLKARAEQLARDNDQLAGIQNGNRRGLAEAQARVAELEKQLEEARTVRTRGGDDSAKLRTDLAEASQANEKLNTTVAELTATNDRLEKDLETARKSVAAALAAQSQAVNAAQPDAYKMEISTLQARVKELEGQIEDERGNAAKEVATMAAQLARTRETNKSLTEANRALMSAKQSEAPVVDKEEFDRLQARVRDLNAAVNEVHQQNEKLLDDQQALTAERETLKLQLADARKAATVLPGLAEEKTALQERLEAVGAQFLKAQQEVDTLQKENADTASQLVASRQAAEKAQADLAGLQGRATEAEKAAESHNVSVAELTEANGKLETERNDLRRQVTALKADNTRLTQAAGSLEQMKADADRSAQQNIDSLAAQLAQARRDLQGAREANSRLVEGNVTQERERTATLAQLQQQNAALAARLQQAQGTLDQIASAARLGTPAAALAAGNPPPIPVVRTAPAGAEVRYHTVGEGDSLSRISMRYYGTPNRWQEIYNANRDVLQGSSALRVGMQLRIP